MKNKSLGRDPVISVDGYGVSITVERGHLVIKDGFPSEGKGREIRFPRGDSEIQRIIVRSQTGHITMAALDWCQQLGIAVVFVAADSRIVHCYIPPTAADGPLKRAQAVAGVTEAGVHIARNLLRQKFQAQLDAVKTALPELGLVEAGSSAQLSALKDIEAATAGLEDDSELSEFHVREGRAALAYRRLLHGAKLPWQEKTLKRIPEHWAQIWPRESGLKSVYRDATDPFNAIVNYGYTLLEVEMRIACHAEGLDPDLGLLHVDDRLRASLAYDLMEPIRSFVDVKSFSYCKRHPLRLFHFHELGKGAVRLDPNFAREYARWLMPQLRPHTRDAAASFAREVRKIKVPYRLTNERKPDKRAATGRTIGECGMCKAPLKKAGQKFCSQKCNLKNLNQDPNPMRHAHQKLAELRAQGLDPAHGGDAAKKRGVKIADSNRRNKLNLTEEERRVRNRAQQRARYALKQIAKKVIEI